MQRIWSFIRVLRCTYECSRARTHACQHIAHINMCAPSTTKRKWKEHTLVSIVFRFISISTTKSSLCLSFCLSVCMLYYILFGIFGLLFHSIVMLFEKSAPSVTLYFRYFVHSCCVVFVFFIWCGWICYSIYKVGYTFITQSNRRFTFNLHTHLQIFVCMLLLLYIYKYIYSE